MSSGRSLEELLISVSNSACHEQQQKAMMMGDQVRDSIDYTVVDGNMMTLVMDDMFRNDSEITSVNSGMVEIPGSILSEETVTQLSSQVKLKNNIVFNQDMTKSSPCSPTFMEENGIKAQKRQRSLSDSGEQLTAQDRACLEEIERGSQLVPEEKELFEYLSKNKFDLNMSGQHKVLKKKVVIMKNDNIGFVSSSSSLLHTSKPSTSLLHSYKPATQSKPNNNIGLNNVDALESALLQSSIPVTLSNKKRIATKSKSVRSNATIVNSQQILNSDEVINANIVEESATNDIIDAVMYDSESELSQSIRSIDPNQVQNLPVNIQQTVSAAVPQTIQKVVVHVDGKEQVFELPPLEGGALTVQPLTLLPSGILPGATTDSDMRSLLLASGYTLADDNCMLLPVEETTEEMLQATDKPRRVIQQLQLNPDGTVVDITEKPYICEDCGMAYAKPSKLKLHVMSKHTGDRPFKCPYPGCDWAFTAKYKLQRHEECHENRKNGVKEFKCPEKDCGKSCTTIYNLNTHMKLHTRPLSEKCEVCGDQFGTLKGLDKHMKRHGEQYKNVKCPVDGCTKLFYSKASMGSHMLSHQRGTHFPCTYDGCDKVFAQKCKLQAHLRYHTKEKPFKCTSEGCNWAFSNSSHLRRHLKTHTNERNYICEICDKKFLRPEHLKGHMISHSGEKPFICNVPGCNARFSAKSTMYIHMKKHNRMDINLCACPIEGCQKIFQGKTYLRKHIDQHYGKEAKEEKQEHSKDASTKETEIIDTSGLQFINLNLPNSQINQIIVTPELAQSLLAASAGSLMETGAVANEEDCQPITIPYTVSEDPESSTEGASSSSGSARTDYHSNHLLSVRAKKRRQILKQKAAQAGFDLISVQDIADTSKMTRFEDDPDNGSGPVMNPNEVMTSRAITIRDPETGAIYVQTQLLQDDPPNLEFDDSMLDCGKTVNFSAELANNITFSAEIAGLIHDANLAETVNTNSIAEFPGSVSSPDMES